MKREKHILICPLDWGLGHATRCIPIIRKLLNRGCNVSIASNGLALALLKSEFSQLTYHELTGYDPLYSSNDAMMLPMARQLPKFIQTIRKEHREIEQIIQRDGIDVVVSDNRYGCWSERVPSIFITHQLNIRVPRFLSEVVRYLNHQHIKRFTQCWVPDWNGTNALAGNLSRSNGMPVTYIGPLSRFQLDVGVGMKYEFIAIVSGPEPQRAIFEGLMRKELKKISKKSLLVKGLPGEIEQNPNSGCFGRSSLATDGLLEEVNHLSSTELNRALQASKVVISRPGYSTIMDLAVLGSKAIFIPTPGQTEQEYLGKELMERKIALCVDQRKFDLQIAIEGSASYRGFSASHVDSPLGAALDTLLL